MFKINEMMTFGFNTQKLSLEKDTPEEMNKFLAAVQEMVNALIVKFYIIFVT
jgi:hypothetical protein